MLNSSYGYKPSALLVAASLTLGSELAPAQDQSTSQACRQEQLAEKEDDKAETKSELLAKCDGVIRPPQVGDQEMIEPAPSVGRTPVIKPEQNR